MTGGGIVELASPVSETIGLETLFTLTSVCVVPGPVTVQPQLPELGVDVTSTCQDKPPSRETRIMTFPDTAADVHVIAWLLPIT